MKSKIFIAAVILLAGLKSYCQDPSVTQLKTTAERSVADDTTHKLGWKTGGVLNLGIAQGSTSNWAAGGEQFSKLPDLMMPGGRIALFGRTAGNIPDISTRTLYWKQISIHGSTMGTRDEFLSMLDLLESRNVKPVIDQVFPFEKFDEAFQRMEKSDQFGKIVLQIK